MCHHWTFGIWMVLSWWPGRTLIQCHWEIHSPQFNLIVIKKREKRAPSVLQNSFTKSVIMLFVLSCPTCDFCLSSSLYPSMGLHPINNAPKVGLLWLSSRRRSFQLDESSHLSSVSSATSHYSSVFCLFQATWLAHCGCASLPVQWDGHHWLCVCLCVCVCVSLNVNPNVSQPKPAVPGRLIMSEVNTHPDASDG